LCLGEFWDFVLNCEENLNGGTWICFFFCFWSRVHVEVGRRGDRCVRFGGIFGLISARVCLGWAWVRRDEGFGERITFRGEGFGERITTGTRGLVRE
jgi:hypothetical protein